MESFFVPIKYKGYFENEEFNKDMDEISRIIEDNKDNISNYDYLLLLNKIKNLYDFMNIFNHRCKCNENEICNFTNIRKCKNFNKMYENIPLFKLCFENVKTIEIQKIKQNSNMDRQMFYYLLTNLVKLIGDPMVKRNEYIYLELSIIDFIFRNFNQIENNSEILSFLKSKIENLKIPKTIEKKYKLENICQIWNI